MAGFLQADAAHVQGRRVAGTQAQRRSGCLGGAVIVAQRGQGGGEVGVGGGIVGAQANGGAQRGRGVRRAPQTKQDDAEAAVKRRGARGDHDRLADQIRGCLGIAALVRQKAQFMQRVGVMGRLPKDGAAAGNGRRLRAGSLGFNGGGDVRAGFGHGVCLGGVGDI